MNYEVEKVREKLIRQGWPKFLNWVKIEGLRGWNGEKIEFKFPVCVIAGENGSGKSTVLQVAAAAYNNPRGKKYTYYPSSFFPDTAWEIVSNAHLEFEIKEGENTFVYRVNKSQKKWRFKPQDRKPERYVVWQDISRTLPLSSTAGYAALAKRTAQEIRSERVNVVADLSEIMGREYDGAMLAVGQYGKTQKPVGVVKIRDKDISQFHQGAGEDATFDLLNTLEKIPAGALLLIDEIEASLHPRAQRKLVHFLLRLARKKYVQVILSSHSPFVLEELPSEARILLMRGADSVDVLYGV
jgi:predicted ATP-dependent endonuclease of OLD family